jgi:hypothetical protein
MYKCSLQVLDGRKVICYEDDHEQVFRALCHDFQRKSMTAEEYWDPIVHKMRDQVTSIGWKGYRASKAEWIQRLELLHTLSTELLDFSMIHIWHRQAVKLERRINLDMCIWAEIQLYMEQLYKDERVGLDQYMALVEARTCIWQKSEH